MKKRIKGDDSSSWPSCNKRVGGVMKLAKNTCHKWFARSGKLYFVLYKELCTFMWDVEELFGCREIFVYGMLLSIGGLFIKSSYK